MSEFLTPTSKQIGDLARLKTANSVFEKTPFSLGVVQSCSKKSFLQVEENSALISLMRGIFGFKPPFSFFESEAKAVAALFDRPRLIVGIPVQSFPSDGWWLKLLLDKPTTPKIFAALTTPMTREHTLESFTLGVLDNDVEWKNTLIAVETGEAVSKQWIQDKLTGLGMPLNRVIETIATHSGKCLHLLDISKTLSEKDPLLSLATDIEGVYVHVLKKVGGYNSTN
ncbi:MAG: hypothetical protein JW812_03885 [Alphaproteobacteria bacterium]|nr:hypothetical protein [Alphaproteobacteria bacterium]MBN2780322.1 hypothetical protein [Alphaproteobacteria bacterium]